MEIRNLKNMTPSELSALIPWKQFPSNELVVFDLETTGFSNDDRITEIAAVRLRRGAQEFEKFSMLLNVDVQLSDEVIEITGITNDLLEAEGKPFYVAFGEFKEFLGDSDLYAFNANFDKKFIKSLCKKYNITFSNYIGDTMLVCRKAFPEVGVKLQNYAEHFGIDYSKAHRALEDSIIALKCYCAALAELQRE